MSDNIITNDAIHVKGRGAQINTKNPFLKLSTEFDFFEDTAVHEQTQFTEVAAKSIVNRVDSPDVPADWSMNPYQGCEHGCVYCYARITHEYWGYSAGSDFEQKVMVKKNAAKLLHKRLSSSSWEVSPIMLSGNTDCYQPAEHKFKITRKLLETCLKHNHPVGIITKNSLILRDADILEELAAKKLVHVHVSITTLDEKLRRTMEPRTSSVANRFKTVKELSKIGVPVNVMMAPIIPGLNSTEVFDMAEKSKDAGAHCLAYTMLRLNGAISILFEDWIRKVFPDKANRVLNLIASAQGGQLHNHEFGVRMKGKGVMAESIAQSFRLARKKFELNNKMPSFDLSLFKSYKHAQLDLF
ncbi:MAG: PA0069 family radical SAM protein [Bacteroidia bacterium]